MLYGSTVATREVLDLQMRHVSREQKQRERARVCFRRWKPSTQFVNVARGTRNVERIFINRLGVCT